MDIKAQLLATNSRINCEYIASAIGNDNKSFQQLLELIFNEPSPLPERASWVTDVVTDHFPKLINPHLNKIIQSLDKQMHQGVKRILLKIIVKGEIPKKLMGKLLNTCYAWLLDSDETIGVRANALLVIFEISKSEPDIIPELVAVIHELSGQISIGFDSRARKILKSIKKRDFYR